MKVVEGEMIHGNKFLCDIGKIPIMNISTMKMIIEDKIYSDDIKLKYSYGISQVLCSC